MLLYTVVMISSVKNKKISDSDVSKVLANVEFINR